MTPNENKPNNEEIFNFLIDVFVKLVELVLFVVFMGLMIAPTLITLWVSESLVLTLIVFTLTMSVFGASIERLAKKVRDERG